ncbi:MAG: S8 family serine peptidase, partial [Bacteroidota bacterium]
MTHSLRTFSLVLTLSLFFDVATSQSPVPSRTWIVFQDRGSSAAQLQSASPNALGITERALRRRAKVLQPGQLIDELDLPLTPEYLEAVRSTGATIHATSRWLNAVSVEATPGQLQACLRLPFVQSTQPVAVFKKNRPDASPTSFLEKGATAASLDYGQSFTQLNNIKVVDVHNLGINGYGVIVGMVDDGYNNHRTHNALKNIDVLAEYDFVQRDSNTSRASGEFFSQGNHGSYTLSALAGFDSGNLIGPAYGASLLLAKTEVDSVEVRVEEDLYVEGLEWLESLGADIVSSSLGYIDWYTYRDLDGKTAVTTKAALVAARKGVLLVTAAGNEGNFRTFNPDSTGTLIAPADADSIVTVGAVSSNGVLAGFSSTGPTFDGRIKPEVVAQGVSVYAANGASPSNYISVSGTSLSTPLTAGAAALVLSAHPELTPMQVREALLQTALRINDGTSRTTTYPNNFYGYGMVNALDAVLYHGIAFSSKPQVVVSGNQLTVTISIASKASAPLVPDSLFMYYRTVPNSAFQRVNLTETGQGNQYS